ncbi:MAG: hypothetical protein N2440_02795, partial [Actinobacteria bacterium]|nr:hypothetical protein [Actinomycetota bacterium]
MKKRIWLKLVVIAVILLTARNTYHPCYANSFKIELPFSYEVVVPFGPIKDGIQKWHYGVDLKASLNS